MLHNLCFVLRTALLWEFLTDILGQPISPTFKGQKFVLFGFLPLEDGSNRLSQNVSKKLQLLSA